MGAFLVGWALWATSAWSCPPAELEQAVLQAEGAFAANDAAASGVAMRTVERTVSCIEEPLAPGLVARVHRASAYTRFLRGDQRGVLRAVRGMVHADPQLALGEGLPHDHPLRRAQVAAEEAPIEWRRSAVQWVNGLHTGAVPRDHDVIVQRSRKNGMRTRLK